MVSTKGLCATIALMCVIVPIIIGHCMPVGESEHTGYATDNRVNITSDLLNDSTTIYQTTISDNNNVPFISFAPNQTSNTASSIPAYTRSTTYNVTDSITPSLVTDVTTYTGTFTVSYDGNTYSDVTRITILPDMYLIATNTDYINSGTSLIVPAADYGSVTISFTGDYTKHVYATNGQFVDPAYGGGVSNTYGGGVWANGYDNSRIGILIQRPNSSNGCTLMISSENDSAYFGIRYISGSGWYLQSNPPYTNPQVDLGDFKQVYLEIDALNDEIRLSALVYSNILNKSPEERIIKTVTMSLASSIDTINVVNVVSTGGFQSCLCWDADINVGTQAMISNNTLSIDSYYPSQTAMIEFSGAAFYGDSLLLPGFSQAAAVSDGTITYDDVNGDSHTTKIRESVLVCEYIGNGLYDVYYDDNQIGSGVAVSDMDITFNGNWLLNVYAYPASEYTYSQYDFDFTTLNVDHNEYCFIGMATAILSFVIAAFIGKRSGGKATWCLLISALGFAIYFGLMDL